MARFNKKKFFENQKNTVEEEPDTVIIQETPIPNSSKTNSWIKTGTKYASVISMIVLLSGIFTPFTFGYGEETVVSGILVLIMALVGGILLFLGVSKQVQSYSTILILAGLALMVISLMAIISLSGYN